MSISLFNQNLKEARRDALVSYYLATHDFSSLPEGSSVTTADDLYEYLLLDTKISNAVTTSRLAEAISSLQLFIHRSLEGYEGELAGTATSYLAQDAFLDNWDQYNKRYSTWAGKEKLRFYAGNYVDPTLRMNKTEVFENLENNINQARLTTDSANKALQQYLIQFEILDNIVYISSCNSPEGDDVYFLGKDACLPQSYYWRRYSKKGVLKWSEWKKLPAMMSQTFEDKIFPYIDNGRLNVLWITKEKVTSAEGNSADTIYYANAAKFNNDSSWTIIKKDEVDPKILPCFTNKPGGSTLSVSEAGIPVALDIIPANIIFSKSRNTLYFLGVGENGYEVLAISFGTVGSVLPYIPRIFDVLSVSSAQEVEKLSAYIKNDVLIIDVALRNEDETLDCREYTIDIEKGMTCSPIDVSTTYKPAIKHATNVTDVNSEITRTVTGYSMDVTGYFVGVGDFHFQAEYDNATRQCKIFQVDGALLQYKVNEDDYVAIGDASNPTIVSLKEKALDIYDATPFYRIEIYEEVVDAEMPDFPPSDENYGEMGPGFEYIPPEGSLLPHLAINGFDPGVPSFDIMKYIGLSSDDELDEKLFTYEVQDNDFLGGDVAFNGHNGLYLWEIFFHIPYLVATRFATEQRFEEAERWYKYIFNSAGYRDEDGKILTDDKDQPRYWNCYPLQQDVAWDSFADMPASTDPDMIATADPMHYKLAIFQHTLDLLIARGDAAYRLLERDTLTEAKMYYVQAQQLLGPRPDIRVTNTWDNPTLSAEADAIQNPATRSAEGASLTFAQWLRAGDANEMGDGNFLPPYNDVLLAYWDKLDIRLYNLRHNLSLDGQPLSLPLFATPVDPAELHRQQSGGNGIQGEVSPAELTDTGWRYPLLADHARYAVGQLSQFGSTLLGALERRDGEQLTLLLQTQQITVLGQQQDIAQKNLDSLNASLESLNTSRASAEMRKSYYDNLINGSLSAAEEKGLTLRNNATQANVAASALMIYGGSLSAIPNIFGMADGGGDLGAPVTGAGWAAQTIAGTFEQAASVSEVTAGYRRRAEEWALQSELADKDISQAESQIDSLKAQIAMQQKQIALAEMESANAQAVYDLQSSRFTGQELYNWMVSRLSSLYYQLYDATIPVCIQAREALKRELGSSKTDGIFSTPVWNDLYQGLLAGEGLTTGLQKLENVWLQNSANGLEATRTVSLAALRGEKNGSLSTVITGVLNGSPDKSEVGKLKLDDAHIFSAVLDMSTLQLADDYGPTSSNKTLFIKSIAVTLPTLLGPYQDIAATLSDDKGTVATLSHGMQDTGRFVVNFDDSRFLPFEGRDPRTMTLTLSIFNVKDAGDAAPNQRSIVENLSDIIFHIRYIMRNS
ncbi:Tc toxin subunit A-related protein [Intestinirhabdus alba]|jgi:hypothetical protein|uniref:Tc toxin subunit A-related protein n=1 Tax=Intestinirhabdus alba TaxID=2899544 RepID=UPI001E31D881|nr:neuraminidase-like domain-containing protein [Intestinirhabdus alba]